MLQKYTDAFRLHPALFIFLGMINKINVDGYMLASLTGLDFLPFHKASGHTISTTD